MKRHRAFIVLTLAALLASVLAFVPTPPIASADCISQSGNGDVDVWIGPFSMSAGSSITATMTAGAGGEQPSAVPAAASAGTAIAVLVGGLPVQVSVEFVTPHTLT